MRISISRLGNILMISFPGVETNLPENIKERAVSVFKAAVSQKYVIKDVIEKVQKEGLAEVENVFKGQRFKVETCHHRFKLCNIYQL